MSRIKQVSLEELSATLRRSGVAGAGGAGFPTYAKLDRRADVILMNCAECEPLLKLHRQLLEYHAGEIVAAFHLLAEGLESLKRRVKAAGYQVVTDRGDSRLGQ